MSTPKVKELLVYKKDVVLKSASHTELTEHEYLTQHTVYNENGKVHNEKHFSTEGSLVGESQFKYNNNDLLVSLTTTEEDGSVTEHKTYEYDDKGKIAREFVHYMDDSYDTITWQHNNPGQVIRKQTTDSDGELESTEEFEYSGEHLTRYAMTDGSGDIIAEKQITRDDNGNETEIVDYDRNDDATTRKVIEYYPSGNRKETLVYNDSGRLTEKVQSTENDKGQVVEVIEETAQKKNTIKYSYDEKGNIIQQEEFNRQGDLIGTISRVWGDNGQLIESDVFIDGGGLGLSRKYTLRHEYRYF